MSLSRTFGGHFPNAGVDFVGEHYYRFNYCHAISLACTSVGVLVLYQVTTLFLRNLSAIHPSTAGFQAKQIVSMVNVRRADGHHFLPLYKTILVHSPVQTYPIARANKLEWRVQ